MYGKILRVWSGLLAAAFISIGTEAIILNKYRHEWEPYKYVTSLGFSEYLKQHLACDVHKSQPLFYMERVDELLIGNERRVVSYLKKRIPCTCLDETFTVVKSLPKIGHCSNIGCRTEGIELSAMKSCGGCRRSHYCCESCHAAHWPDHKEECKQWRKWQASVGSE